MFQCAFGRLQPPFGAVHRRAVLGVEPFRYICYLSRIYIEAKKMFQKIVHFSVRSKLFVGLTTLMLLLGGLYAMWTLPVDAVPDITNNQVQIVTISPTLAPQEVEQLITFPIEIAMSNIMKVQEIRSVSRFGLSLVTVVFDESVPTLQARQLIN